MARPLTKKTQAGAQYVRDPDVDAQIDKTVGMDLGGLKQRLRVTTPAAPDHLRSECLVHLVRHGVREDNQPLVTAALTALFARCEANLAITRRPRSRACSEERQSRGKDKGPGR